MVRGLSYKLQMSGVLLTVVIPVDEDLASDPLRGINVEAAGGAGKVLRMLAEKVSLRQARTQEMYEVAYAAGRPS